MHATPEEPLADTPETTALRWIEGGLLARALIAADDFPDRIREFIAVRSLRYAAAGDAARGWDDAMEVHEGVAEFVGLRAALPADVAPADAAAALLPQLAQHLTHPFVPGPPIPLSAAAYGTGAAQALILERLRAPWKPRVARGEAMFSILESAFPVADVKRRAERVKREYGYGVLVKRARLRASQPQPSSSDRFDRFAAAAGTRLVLRLWDVRAGSALNTVGSGSVRRNRATLYSKLSTGELHGLDELRAAFRETDLVSRTGDERNARKIGRASVFPHEYEVLLGDSRTIELTLDGRRATAAAEWTAFRKLNLKTPHAVVDSARPGRISFDGLRVLVEIDPKP